MGNGSVGEPNPFQGALWDDARRMIGKSPRGLSDDQLLTLVDKATADTIVTPQEEKLLQALVDPANVRKISQALKANGRRADFNVQGLDFASPRAAKISRHLEMGVNGQKIGNSYDVTAASRQPAIQEQARQTEVGPGHALNMATNAGRDAILDTYGQLMGSGIYGPQACSAAVLLGLAVNAGPQGLGALVRIVRDDQPYNPTFAGMCDRMAEPDAQFTLGDLARLQDALLERMQLEDNNRVVKAGKLDGEESVGLSMEALDHFVNDHREELSPLFAGGAKILAIDNTGDGKLDHFAAYVPRHGIHRVFEPFETASGRHLITDLEQLRQYDQASGR